jgi:hypothetical protein
MKSGKRKPGGRKGSNRELIPTEEVHRVILVFPEVCDDCIAQSYERHRVGTNRPANTGVIRALIFLSSNRGRRIPPSLHPLLARSRELRHNPTNGSITSWSQDRCLPCPSHLSPSSESARESVNRQDYLSDRRVSGIRLPAPSGSLGTLCTGPCTSTGGLVGPPGA